MKIKDIEIAIRVQQETIAERLLYSLWRDLFFARHGYTVGDKVQYINDRDKVHVGIVYRADSDHFRPTMHPYNKNGTLSYKLITMYRFDRPGRVKVLERKKQ